MRRPTVIALAFGALLLLGVLIPRPAVAGRYVLHHPKRQHCRTHYVRRVERVKLRRHHRVVRARRVFCVYRAPKAPVPKQSTPAPSTPTPAAPVVKLHAHLDPTFTQDPKNPRAVTYSYSASATQTSGTLSAQPASLPEGVLNLYSDGLLVCSANVGGSVTGAQCPVTYSALGEHTVVTTYSSGSASATETSVEHVEPFSTTTTLSVTQTGCGQREELDKGWRNGKEYARPYTVHFCTYSFSVSAVDQNGNAVPAGAQVGKRNVPLGDTLEATEEVHPAWEEEGASGTAYTWCRIFAKTGEERDGEVAGACPTTSYPLVGWANGPSSGWAGSQSAPQSLAS